MSSIDGHENQSRDVSARISRVENLKQSLANDLSSSDFHVKFLRTQKQRILESTQRELNEIEQTLIQRRQDSSDLFAQADVVLARVTEKKHTFGKNSAL